MGTLLRRQPHTLVVKKPKSKKDSENNASYWDYDDPASTRDVKGLFQTRGGITSISGEGGAVPFDAMFYTTDTVIEAHDRVEVDLPGAATAFIALGVEPKYTLRQGTFSHNEVTLQKESKR